ncbi:MAG: hypothetical protein RBU30_20025 [Polyangia bacterium]|jgi:cysteine-rich repeat protein|nr:hypothetical protein [Polyangia bacterium]
MKTVSLVTIGVLLVGACGDDDGGANNQNQSNQNNQSQSVCGNGTREGSEECDDGAQNSDTTPDACRSDCRLARCGDGALDTGEACDEGLANSDAAADACRTSCVLPTCGDGVVDVAAGETCDCGNGATTMPYRCSAPNGHPDGACGESCLSYYCGNQVLDPGEECDDGNNSSGDGCGPTCKLEACGNGFLDPGEECDDGEASSDVLPDACRTDCTLPRCGDGVEDTGEACDDGDLESGDGCSALCRVEHCGNGVVDAGEECDDGNPTSGDGCQYNCRLPRCGDGVQDAALQEECDEGTSNSDTSADACRTNCQLPRCGDGVTDTGEICDDGNSVRGDGCDPDCQGQCGNGAIDSTGELCDGAELGTESCVSYGWDRGRLACGTQCTPDFTGCQQMGWEESPLSGHTSLRAYTAVHGTGPNDIWVTALGGWIGHHDGSAWTFVQPAGNVDLNDVYALAENDVYAVGNGGTLLHFNGVAWSPVGFTIPSNPTANLLGVFASPTVVGAVGQGGVIIYNALGAGWSELSSGTTRNLNAIWASAWDSIYVVGGARTVLHITAPGGVPNVAAEDLGTGTEAFHDVWGSSSGDIHAVGDQMAARYRDEVWTLASRPNEYYRGLHGLDANHVFAAGVQGLMAINDGTVWSRIESPSDTWFTDIWGMAGGEIIAVGNLGSVYRYTGSVLSEHSTGTTQELKGVWGTSLDDAIAVGTGGTILRLGPSGWTADTSNTTQGLIDVWGADGDNVFAVGENRTVMRYNGTSWAAMSTPATAGRLLNVHGTGPNNVWVVGQSSTSTPFAMRWNGASWTVDSPPASTDIKGVWVTDAGGSPEVWACADGGGIFHWQGGAWASQSSGVGRLSKIWGTSPSEILAVGPFGFATRYNGTSWTRIETGVDSWLLGLHGTSIDDAFAVSGAGRLLHYDGVAWNPVRTDTTEQINDVWAVGTSVLLVGSFGYQAKLHRISTW